jgi:hypothetical protein
MKICRCVIAMLVMTVLFLGVSGCKKEGPAEKAGKSIDKAVDKSGKEIEKVGKKIQGDDRK